MYSVIIYGCGKYFRDKLPELKQAEIEGFLKIIGISGRELPEGNSFEGLPLIPAERLSSLSFDFLLLMSKKFVDEMIREIPEKYGIDRSRLVPYRVTELPGVDIQKYFTVRNRKITIFSNNCWGGNVSKALYLEHRSPFKNLWMYDHEYIKFLSDPEHYLKIDPVFDYWQTAMSQYDQEVYPVLRLDDIQVFCNHDTDPETAIQNWIRRANKVNLDDVLAVFTTESPERAKDFLNMTRFPNRYCLTDFESENSRIITLPPAGDEQLINTVMRFANKSIGPCAVIDMLLGSVYCPLWKEDKKMNETHPKVSVVIPVYNVEKYLADCLDSVLNQTLRDIEVICIDDASPDRCGEILDDYARKDSRVRVLHLPENHQQGYGRNRGLEMAAGKYVYFLDSDDMITEDALDKLYRLAEYAELDGIFFDSQAIYESESLRKKDTWYQAGRIGSYEDRTYSGRELYDAFVTQRDWNVFVQRQFWRREYLIENEIYSPENTEHEDEFFSTKAILLAQRVRYINEPFFIHRFRANSVMTRPKNAKDFHGYFRNYCLLLELAEKYGLSGETIDWNIAHKYEWMILTYPLFAAKEDPRNWFKTEEELKLYRFFAASQSSELWFAKRVRRILSEVGPYQRIWIYGAGVIGKRVYADLLNLGVAVEGFLVTTKGGNPDTLFDRPVKAIDEVEPDKDKCAIVAVSKPFREEIIQELESRGWRYTVYIYGVDR